MNNKEIPIVNEDHLRTKEAYEKYKETRPSFFLTQFSFDDFNGGYKSRDAEIQRLKESLNQQIQAWQFEYGKAKQYEEQIQHLKSSRVKDIEDAWDAGGTACYESVIPEGPCGFDNVAYEKKKSEYLKPFTADSK